MMEVKRFLTGSVTIGVTDRVAQYSHAIEILT
jgi:hypothetical protein